MDGNVSVFEPCRGDGASANAVTGFLKSLERTLVRYNLEARGIQRVLPSQRHSTKHLGFMQIGMLWFSINLAANNITLGMLGPTIFYLPFLDSCLCAVFGMLVGKYFAWSPFSKHHDENHCIVQTLVDSMLTSG